MVHDSPAHLTVGQLTPARQTNCDLLKSKTMSSLCGVKLHLTSLASEIHLLHFPASLKLSRLGARKYKTMVRKKHIILELEVDGLSRSLTSSFVSSALMPCDPCPQSN